jgi:hypothetical protein
MHGELKLSDEIVGCEILHLLGIIVRIEDL